jgi:phospholipid N-methyltransferase
MPTRGHGRFVAQFVRHPKLIGAVVPSSAALARRVVASMDWTNVDSALEYGAGTGVVTKYILSRLRPGAKFVAIEINSTFAAVLREQFPGVAVSQDSVANVASVCEQHGLETVDAIVSGLPWASFSDQEQTTYLDATMSVLKPEGQFVTFGYWQGLLLPAGRRFKKKLRRYFTEVRRSKPIWANVPPAFLYRCRR